MTVVKCSGKFETANYSVSFATCLIQGWNVMFAGGNV